MARVVKQQILELEASDEAILRVMAGECGVSRAQILRWALRHYLLLGPWPKHPAQRHIFVEDLHVGPFGPKPCANGGVE